MRIPGPSDVVSFAMRGVGSGLQVGMQLASLPTRAIGIVEHTEVLLARIEMLTSVVERVVEETQSVVAGATGTLATIDELPEHLKNELVPLLASLEAAALSVADLAKLTDGVRQAIGGVPGLGLLRRPGPEL